MEIDAHVLNATLDAPQHSRLQAFRQGSPRRIEYSRGSSFATVRSEKDAHAYARSNGPSGRVKVGELDATASPCNLTCVVIRTLSRAILPGRTIRQKQP
eukprot:6214773-Pleurochrysis_carterae.AAC.4